MWTGIVLKTEQNSTKEKAPPEKHIKKERRGHDSYQEKTQHAMLSNILILTRNAWEDTHDLEGQKRRTKTEFKVFQSPFTFVR